MEIHEMITYASGALFIIFLLLSVLTLAKKRSLKRLLPPLLLFLAAFVFSFFMERFLPPQVPDGSSFQIHYIDVGQADSALVLCDGHSMLIDGGNVEDSDLVYSYLDRLDIGRLDYVVCTHAHEDHVGGLSGALNRAEATTALCPVVSYDSQAFDDFVHYLGDTQITVPSPGDSYTLGSSSFSVLGPVNSSDDPNNTSIVLKIEYGQTSFLFTGDAEHSEEEDILEAGYDVSADVLKVGHHGSDTSTSEEFLDQVSPEYAVISSGEGNSYGHPSKSILTRLADADVTTYRTDMQGTIVCTSDGQDLTFSVERNPDAYTLDPDTAGGVFGSIEPDLEDSGPSHVPDGQSQGVSDAGKSGYILNTSTMRFHYPDCPSVEAMSQNNRQESSLSREELIEMGYVPCGSCDP